MNVDNIIANPKRGCGYLVEGGIYLRSDLHPGGAIPPFVKYVAPIPCYEQHFRSWKVFSGLQMEIANSLETKPENEIEMHVERLMACADNIKPDGTGNDLGRMTSPWTQDLIMWIGEQYYPTPDDFIDEVCKYGLNKRIRLTEPPLIWPGKTKLYLIHPNGIPFKVTPPETEDDGLPCNKCGLPTRRCVCAEIEKKKKKKPKADGTPALIGYCYLTRVIYTRPEKETPKWVEDLSTLGRMDIVEIAPRTDEEDQEEEPTPA